MKQEIPALNGDEPSGGGARGDLVGEGVGLEVGLEVGSDDTGDPVGALMGDAVGDCESSKIRNRSIESVLNCVNSSIWLCCDRIWLCCVESVSIRSMPLTTKLPSSVVLMYTPPY